MSGLAQPTARTGGDIMIEADGVSKVFGSLRALDSVSVSARRGTVLALLGHNGAGKTTLVNVLTAALPPSSGRAAVAGFDVSRDPHEVRKRVGLTGQFASVDAQLSGRDNLVLLARLLGADRKSARARADELLELFGLQDFAARRPGTYSGGLRRRLDLAASLVGHPDVVFLDEPTTGLDPSSRLNLWEIVEDLVAGGTTVLLTTQYLDEADRLADSIAVLSAGAVIASGTAAELKSKVGQRTVTVTPEDGTDPAVACEAIRRAGLEPVVDRANGTIVVVIEASKDAAVVIRALDGAGIEVTELSFGEPTLDDVYLTLAERPTGFAS
ncbi:ATP-binding cassette domain-containing protein [Streptomyces olivoreticuli]|uniref:ATP-binding cassette domain-containing protein n=1 Tax=Streptomyces olivoreticuli TaxID=68246 RepID=UPI001F07D911|nr:ATP-binding cassette domain-containing protein [Streptomyces olivoreticuli]